LNALQKLSELDSSLANLIRREQYGYEEEY
jgi:hypothetical protein